jgi:hypothetical protein
VRIGWSVLFYLFRAIVSEQLDDRRVDGQDATSADPIHRPSICVSTGLVAAAAAATATTAVATASTTAAAASASAVAAATIA